MITVVNSDTDVENQIRSKITLKVNNYFANNGIFGKVTEDTLNEYLTIAGEYDISVGHVKLIMVALEYNSEYTFEDLVNMPINEVVALTKIAHQNLQKNNSTNQNTIKIRY